MGIDANDYFVAVDADVIRDADKFKMDLVGGLERTLHGQVKPSMPLSTLPNPLSVSEQSFEIATNTYAQ